MSLFDLNRKGIQINDKIIIIESDDWGSLRSNKDFFLNLIGKYPKIADSAYLQFDQLESSEDLESLFEVLTSVKDREGAYPKITANTVIANPDFKKIQEDSFENYHFEPFTQTIYDRDGHNKVYDLYIEGLENNIFIPQFHGREHVNVKMWLQLLKHDPMFQEAFKYNVWGISKDVRPDLMKSIQATYDTDFETAKNSIIQGLTLFREIFGFASSTFIANNFIWDSSLNEILSMNGVRYFQGMKYQLLPAHDNERRKKKRHFFGEMNHLCQFYGIRNCSLEISEGKSSLDSCLRQIKFSFNFKKPAIISMHRLNVMGGMDTNNRKRGLEVLKKLLKNVMTLWPDVIFMSTPELAEYMKQ